MGRKFLVVKNIFSEERENEKHQKWMNEMEISSTQLTTRASKAIICWCYRWKMREMSDANTPHTQNRFFLLASLSPPVPKTLKESYHCLLLTRRSFVSEFLAMKWNKLYFFRRSNLLRSRWQRRLRALRWEVVRHRAQLPFNLSLEM